jgi:CRISPR/Cas system-associated protein Csm6
METIMTLVIDESEEISAELLTLLLVSVKKQNQVCHSSNVSLFHHGLDRFD